MKYLILLGLLLSCAQVTPIYQRGAAQVYESAQPLPGHESHKKINNKINIEQTNAVENVYQAEDVNYNQEAPPAYQPEVTEQTVEIDDEFVEDITEKNIEIIDSKSQDPLVTEIHENLNQANVNLDAKVQASETVNNQTFIDHKSIIVQESNISNQQEIKKVEPVPVPVREIADHGPIDLNFIVQIEDSKRNKWIDYFTTDSKDRIQRFFNNGSKYKNFIMKTFIEEGLPKELYYVGIIESGYQMNAISSAKAVGPWQFIKGAGKEYGLKINSYVDERRNIYKATKAAALYFKDLYNIFGSWELALSAYNAGPYRIIGQIRRYNSRDYLELTKQRTFPRETAEYVPKLAAIMEIANNPEAYGITINNNIDVTTDSFLIPVRYSLDLKTIASKLGTSVKSIKKLNPELLKSYTPFRKKSPYQLRISNSMADDRIVSELEYLKGSNPYRRSYAKKTKIASGVHKVKKGETLSHIAMKYRTSSLKIMKLNGFKNPNIFIGQKLKVPGKYSGKKTHQVKNGENLSLIAKKFKTTPRNLMKKNGMKNSKIFPGQKLIVR